MSQSTPKPAVCRRLVFDDEEHQPQGPESAEILNPQPLPEAVIPPNLREACMDNLQNFLTEGLRHSRATAKIKWNFDFEEERPLEGNWEWEKIESSTDNSKNTNIINEDKKVIHTEV